MMMMMPIIYFLKISPKTIFSLQNIMIKMNKSLQTDEIIDYTNYYYINDSPLVDYIVNKNPVLLSHVLEYIIWRNEIDMCKPEIVLCHANIEYFLNSQMIYLGTNGELLNPLHLSIDEIKYFEQKFEKMIFFSAPDIICNLPLIKRSVRIANKHM